MIDLSRLVVFSVKVGTINLPEGSRPKGMKFGSGGLIGVHRVYDAKVSSIEMTGSGSIVRLVCKGEHTIAKREDGKYPEGYIYDRDSQDNLKFVVCKIEYEIFISADVIQAIDEQMAIYGEKEPPDDDHVFGGREPYP